MSTTLPAFARAVITAELGGPPAPVPPGLWEDRGASFVTLTRAGRLRGCIGSLAARRPLAEDVAENARAAAFRDPRFPALTAEELEDLHVEVSVLTEPVPLPAMGRAQAESAIGPGMGIVLEAGGRRATFLPQVWDQLPEPADFLDHLLRKAGLPAGWWGEEVRLSHYAVTSHEEGP